MLASGPPTSGRELLRCWIRALKNRSGTLRNLTRITVEKCLRKNKDIIKEYTCCTQTLHRFGPVYPECMVGERNTTWVWVKNVFSHNFICWEPQPFSAHMRSHRKWNFIIRRVTRSLAAANTSRAPLSWEESGQTRVRRPPSTMIAIYIILHMCFHGFRLVFTINTTINNTYQHVVCPPLSTAWGSHPRIQSRNLRPNGCDDPGDPAMDQGGDWPGRPEQLPLTPRAKRNQDGGDQRTNTSDWHFDIQQTSNKHPTKTQPTVWCAKLFLSCFLNDLLCASLQIANN